MKNIFLFIFITFLISISINAQSLLPNKWGIKVGVNIANVNSVSIEGVQNIDNSSKIGISGGFYSEFPLNDRWYINPEILYSQKGTSFNYDFTHDYDINSRQDYNTKNDLSFTYIELNPIVSFKANHKFALNIGPSAAYLIANEYTYTPSPAHLDNDLPDGEIDDESLDIGLNCGLSYYFTDNFLINGRVTTGFMKITDVIRPIDDDNIPAFSLKNRKFSFFLAYLF